MTEPVMMEVDIPEDDDPVIDDPEDDDEVVEPDAEPEDGMAV